jgi:MraZ protein
MSFQPFISTVLGSLDSKGRVLIPATFRQVLAAQNTTGVFLYPHFVDAALEGFGQAAMDQLTSKLGAMDPFMSPTHDDMALAIMGRVQQLPMDDGGRIRLPDPFIAHAKITDKVAVVGMGTKFRIWNGDAFAAMEAEAAARLKAKFEAAREGGQ